MKLISLTQGKFAKVDDEDYDYLMQWKWYFTGRYACHHEYGDIQKMIYMHRLIMNTPPELEVDHINNLKLDNQKSNLRNCVHSQNSANFPKPKTNTSGYKGIWKYPHRNKWMAQLSVCGKRLYLGTFNTPEEATHAYDKAAVKYYGEFANLNFPEEWINRDKEYE